MSSFQVDNQSHVWLQALAPSGVKLQRSDVEIATIEHLYSLVLGQDPEAMYCLAAPKRKCGRLGDDYSHAQLLRELRDARQLAVTRAGRAGRNVPWQVVSMAPVVQDGGTDDDVAVRVVSDGKPLEGERVFFHRAPHSGCGARSSPDGLATCRLVDRHGDEESHGEDEKVPVVATFPGNVLAERVLLPTTLVMSPRP